MFEYVSRSQAPKNSGRPWEIQIIELDFKKCWNNRQGFADEIFPGVGKKGHKNKRFSSIMANENVMFMIKRAADRNWRLWDNFENSILRKVVKLFHISSKSKKMCFFGLAEITL